MLKKTITYTDYEGRERTEDFWFNLTKAEITETDLSTDGGIVAKYERMTQKLNGAEIIATMKEYILRSYGEKTPDGRYFQKVRDGHHLSEDFEQSPAYDVLFMELVTNASAAAEFLAGIVPEDIGNKFRELSKERIEDQSQPAEVVTLPTSVN